MLKYPTGVTAGEGVTVANRRWLVLLLFAAIFAMHGIQCVGAASMTTASGHALAASAAVADTPDGLVMQASHIGSAFGALPAAFLVDPEAMVAASSRDMNGHPTGLMDHLWTVCLAVLSAFIAGLLAVLVSRRVRTWLPPLLGGRSAGVRARIPPPCPDLSALCVLRI